MVYTSQPNQDAQQTIDAFKAKYPKVDITFVRDGTPRIVAKLRAEMEAGAAQADILLIADAVTMEDLKKDGRLPALIRMRTCRLIRRLTTRTSPGLRPSSSPPASSTTPKRRLNRIVVRSSQGRSQGPGRDADPTRFGRGAHPCRHVTSKLAEGWKYYVGLKTNGGVAAAGNGDVLKQVAGGEKLYGMIVDSWRSVRRRRAPRLRSCFQKRACRRSASRSRSSNGQRIRTPREPLSTSSCPRRARSWLQAGLRAGASGKVALPAGYPARGDIKVLALEPTKALAETKQNTKRFIHIFGQ